MSNTDKNTIVALEADYLYIQESQIANSGNGLYTAIKIYKDEIISVFKGEILSPSEIIKRETEGVDQYFMVLIDGSVLDCMQTNCFAKYANDASGLGKSVFKNNAKITLDDNDNVCLVATSTIKEGQEIFCSYGKKYWKKHSN